MLRILKSIFSGGVAEPPEPTRLESTSEAALSQSLRRLSSEDSGWITMDEARRLFSRMPDQYAFGESDDEGRSNLERFGKQYNVRLDIMPAEGRVYFSLGSDRRRTFL